MGDCQTREEGGFHVVALSGEVDLSWSADVREHVLAAVTGADAVLVDLASVSYIDSSGIAALVEGYQTAKKQSRRFGLVSVSEQVMSVLQLARLDQVFPIHASVMEAASE